MSASRCAWSLVAALVAVVPSAADDTATAELQTCLRQLRSAERFEREEALACLAPMAREDARARRALVGALKDREHQVRASAASWLGELGPDAPNEVVTALVDALGDDEGRVYGSVVWAFGRIGPGAIPALEAALPTHNIAAACALAEIGKPALPALIRALQDPKTRGPAAGGIGRMGKKAAAAVPALIEALKDPGTRLVVLGAMESIGREAAPAVPALIVTLDDPDPSVRGVAIVVLEVIGPAAAAAVPKLWAMSRDTQHLDYVTRMNAARAVKKIQGQ